MSPTTTQWRAGQPRDPIAAATSNPLRKEPRSFAERVAEDVARVIEQHYLGSSLHDLLVRLMTRPGRVLYDAQKAKWPAMMTDVGSPLGVRDDDLLPAATAVEFIIGALDIIDDVVDEELDADLPEKRSLSATLALLTLAEVCTLRLSQRISPSRLAAFRASVSDALINATKGEDLDILYEDDFAVTEQAALDMT